MLKDKNFAKNKTCNEGKITEYYVFVRAVRHINSDLAIVEESDHEDFHEKDEINYVIPYENDLAEYVRLNWTELENYGEYNCDCTILPKTLP